MRESGKLPNDNEETDCILLPSSDLKMTIRVHFLRRGNFHMILNGDEDSSTMLQLNAQEAFFEPGRIYFFMTITHRLGNVKSADLVWQYAEHPFNPLTWRVLSKSRMFVNR